MSERKSIFNKTARERREIINSPTADVLISIHGRPHDDALNDKTSKLELQVPQIFFPSNGRAQVVSMWVLTLIL